MLYIIRRDGEQVHRSEQDPLVWFHRNVSYSMDHAIRYEGYTVTEVATEIRKVAPGKWFAGVTDAPTEQEAQEIALSMARRQTSWPVDIVLHHRDSRDGHLTCWFDIDETVMP